MSKRIGWQVLISCAFCIAYPAFGQATRGRIIGTVINERGTPVPNAQASPQFLGPSVMRTLVKKVDTDQYGRFTIDGLDWGAYAIYAGKKAEGYPDTRIPLYRTRPAPNVVLSPEHAMGYETVVIVPKGGVLVSSVRDAVTHAPVGTELILQKTDGSGLMGISEPPDFQVLLPANADVLVEIRARGYKLWVYAETSGRPLRLKSGEQAKIEVNLTPLEKRDHGTSGFNHGLGEGGLNQSSLTRPPVQQLLLGPATNLCLGMSVPHARRYRRIWC